MVNMIVTNIQSTVFQLRMTKKGREREREGGRERRRETGREVWKKKERE